MVRFVIKFLISVVVLFLFVNLFFITPFWHYYVNEETRRIIIEKLHKKCTSGNTVYLIKTYSDIYFDKNTSQCWDEYRKKCYFNKENNLTLKIPITCLIY